MAAQAVTAEVVAQSPTSLAVRLVNTGSAPALLVKLTLLDGQGRRVLPAYFSDNYVSLLPGERRTVEIRHGAAIEGAVVAVRGWNVAPARVLAATAPARSSGGS